MTKKVRIAIITVLVAVLVATAVLVCVFSFGKRFTVSFETNGGTAMAELKNVKKNSLIKEPTPPVRLDYAFDGWYKDDRFEKAWIFSLDTVTENVTLYAKWAVDYTENMKYTTRLDGTYAVSKGAASESRIVIPHKYFGKDVTALEASAFINHTSLTEIVIPNTVRDIGTQAFYGCRSLRQVVLPDSVINLETYAFGDCVGIESVQVSKNLKKINSMAFANCKKLKEIEIPNGVEEIGTYAFQNCASLTQITLPGSLKSVSAWTFSGCTKLKTLTIENGVTTLGVKMLDGCSVLEKIIFNGTKEQWNRITKVTDWNAFCPVTVVSCIDGEVNI